MIKIYISLFLLLLYILPTSGEEVEGMQILKKMEDNIYASSMIYEGKITINKQDKTFVKTFKGWSVEDKKGFVEFTNREDFGVKYLKVEDELWIAEEGDVIKISGHLLKRSIMGSDFSFEDMMEKHKLSELYDVTVEGEEQVGDESCYILKLESDKDDAPYTKQKVWVGKESYVPYKVEYYALSGRILKSAEILETKNINNKDFPVKIKMMDELRKGSSTLFEMEDVKIGAEIPEEIFSKENLVE
jgi:hypothetical protein